MEHQYYKFGLVCSISFTLRYVALREHEVPVKSIYAKGCHGFGVNNKSTQKQWIEPSVNWILDEKWNK